MAETSKLVFTTLAIGCLAVAGVLVWNMLSAPAQPTTQYVPNYVPVEAPAQLADTFVPAIPEPKSGSVTAQATFEILPRR